MLAIARWTMAHRRFVVVAWLVAAVGVFALSSSVGKKTASSFTLPGTGSQRAVDLLKSRFPTQAGDADQVVFHTRTGTVTDASARATIDSTLARIARLQHVTAVVSPYAAGQHAISKDGTIAFATVSFDQRANALPKAAVDRVITTAESARSTSLQVELGGQAIEQAQQASLGFATVVGILAAIAILLVSFGSFSAMGLPIATALLGLGAGVGVITLASHLIDMPDFASELALMIGLGVGIDYALFIVTRYRQSYKANGGDVRAAVEAAMNTSGRAVLFAGVTVVIALLGMFALGVSVLNGAAVAASIGVVLVLAASLSLLPALLATFRIITLWDLLGVRLGQDPARTIRLFEGLRPSQARVVVLMGDLRRFSPGQAVVRQGERGDEMYVIIQGVAEVWLSANGDRRQIANLKRGDVFGEMGFVSGNERTADVVAETDLEVLAVDEHFMQRIQRRYPRIASKVLLNLSRILSSRLQEANLRFLAALAS